MRPGAIYWADLPEAGLHLIIVISREDLNRGNRVQAVPVSSKHFDRRSRLPTCVPFRAGEYGFTVDCVALCDAVGPIPMALLRDVEAGPVSQLPDEVLRDLILAVGHVMDATCEPN